MNLFDLLARLDGWPLAFAIAALAAAIVAIVWIFFTPMRGE